jgi:UDP-N-acetylglucosamine 2-epimerase (non-hydrolysing)
MKANQSLFDITSDTLRLLEDILKRESPDLVIVQGDTTTTFVASLAAFYLKIKVAHVEAGLRTHDKYNPFPEEINRRLTDCLADLYFVPTENARKNLIREGFPENRIYLTGNTVVDALQIILEKQSKKEIQAYYEKLFYDISIKYSSMDIKPYL